MCELKLSARCVSSMGFCPSDESFSWCKIEWNWNGLCWLIVNVHFAAHKTWSHFLLECQWRHPWGAVAVFFYELVETGSCNIDAEQNGKATFSLSLQRTQCVFPLSTFGVFQTLHLSALTLQQDGMKKSHDQMLDEIEKLLKQKSHLCQHLVCWSLELVFSGLGYF